VLQQATGRGGKRERLHKHSALGLSPLVCSLEPLGPLPLVAHTPIVNHLYACPASTPRHSGRCWHSNTPSIPAHTAGSPPEGARPCIITAISTDVSLSSLHRAQGSRAAAVAKCGACTCSSVGGDAHSCMQCLTSSPMWQGHNKHTTRTPHA
jgi:hypothetical protein